MSSSRGLAYLPVPTNVERLAPRNTPSLAVESARCPNVLKPRNEYRVIYVAKFEEAMYVLHEA
jgi:hypothetical protein